MITKICSRCKEEKEIELFKKRRASSDGRDCFCKQCHNSINKEKYDPVKKASYYSKNRDSILSKKQEYQKKNIDKITSYQREYIKNRIKTDVSYALKKALRKRLLCAVRNNHKAGSAVSDLGCTIEELKLYLESKFQPGMSWDNWAKYGWHIDHVVPLSSFDLTDPEQLKKACHYTNLQPLWAKDNLTKGNKV